MSDDDRTPPRRALALGDLAVVPPHGLAEVVGIAPRTLAGETATFYELALCAHPTRVLVPAGKLAALDLRPLVGAREAAQILRLLSRRANPLRGPWPRVARTLSEKMNSGSLVAAAEVLRDLSHLKARQPLSITSQRLLDAARALVVAELTEATGRSRAEIDDEVRARVDRGARLPCGLRRG